VFWASGNRSITPINPKRLYFALCEHTVIDNANDCGAYPLNNKSTKRDRTCQCVHGHPSGIIKCPTKQRLRNFFILIIDYPFFLHRFINDRGLRFLTRRPVYNTPAHSTVFGWLRFEVSEICTGLILIPISGKFLTAANVSATPHQNTGGDYLKNRSNSLMYMSFSKNFKNLPVEQCHYNRAATSGYGRFLW
jgi:hypothetical protein